MPMNSDANWPLLRLALRTIPAAVAYERAVWGKVHGSPSDFRWIARSAGFSGGADLQRQLSLGAEDLPSRCTAWRNLGDRCYAVSCYPSRASDAAGRSGFVEKQIVEWRRPPGVAAALGALLLLPLAANLGDAIWWDRQQGEPWSQPEFSLPIAAADHAPLNVDVEEVEERIERGRQTLRDSLRANALDQLYQELRAGRRPAFLRTLPEPLPPEALAALLLPLPLDVADRISLAGWIPSSRPSFSDLGMRWDVVAGPSVPTAPLLDEDLEAWQMAETLLDPSEPFVLTIAPSDSRGVPAPHREPPTADIAAPWRPDHRLELTPPRAGAARMLRELYDFAAAANRRWLSPEAISAAGPMPRAAWGDPDAELLLGWFTQVNAQRPPYADADQWAVKVDLLRSAAVAVTRDSRMAAAVGLPRAGSPVPSLYVALFGDATNQLDGLLDIGNAPLCALLHQSVGCGASTAWLVALRQRLRQWQQQSRRRDVGELIAGAFKSAG